MRSGHSPDGGDWCDAASPLILAGKGHHALTFVIVR
jgi:hypothetical protein